MFLEQVKLFKRSMYHVPSFQLYKTLMSSILKVQLIGPGFLSVLLSTSSTGSKGSLQI